MKIALLTETYFPHINGVTTHVKTLKDGLTELGHEVLVVTATPNIKQHYIEDGVLYCPGRKMKKIYGYGLATPYSHKRMNILREFNPDIIHVHNEYGIGLFGIRAAKILKSTLIYTLHTDYDSYMYYVMPKVLARTAGKIMRKYINYYAKKSDGIIGPSPKCFEYIKKASHRKKIRILPNSIEMSLFNSDNVTDDKKRELLNKLGLPENAFVACFVGRMGNEKAVDVTLEYLSKTLQENDNIYYLAIGDGPSIGEFKELAEKLNISDRVIFTGRVEHDDLPAYYAISKVYLTSSLTEMNSISMLEAMAMGVPVLQRVDVINKEQIEEGKNGYSFNNEVELYKHLKRLSTMTDKQYAKIKFMTHETVSEKDELGISKKALEAYEKAIERGAEQQEIKNKRITQKVKRKVFGVVRNVTNGIKNMVK